ncbi:MULTISPECIES: class I SAM-dependent methyltransferase [Thermoactinomyces]|jgi:SAM-dependent methyltransferase|uniref:Methyltransferase domain-containing protein n=1 Tax=Thermoactinomyces daqus TaxID=1329516 RepID=A0A7W1X9Z4_9BACL|nr:MULTISPECIES: class I SAM-dependent methyltransferase [Thermoactinomyces]MBA4542779.1 methyltransferase domain-containing protein [Thermoactinomyces daqus]MBH8598548.1 methyltransferase domain-containing protein [Thermoactinomyces sp. CICC 10523]MBH8604608.1 methyltransferase domain-containing protein [Thermoactinomyces sp. CICC 10522]MBH8606933.1 methyltransferase domain-containing protein [Thermoactinomyces sp. CICC 10521]
MILPSILQSARHYIKQALPPGGFAIDGTVGNGYDTLFLAETTGPSGAVFGFDIQQAALQQARCRLEKAGQLEQVRLFHASHHRMGEELPPRLKGKIHAAMFNLGYLPHGDSSVITRKETTIPALQTALDWLKSGGILTCALYTGHPGGQEEADHVIRFATGLCPKSYQVLWQQLINRKQAPSLVIIEKR